MHTEQKTVIYQLLPRLYTNRITDPVPNGTIQQNGSGKLNYITPSVLKSIKELGATHVWLTGVIEHAQCTDYSAYGILPDNKHIVKGNAGSPYAIKDYYDIDPDLAESVPDRMKEFEAVLKRIHDQDLKLVMDFVPNHVARCYHSDVAPEGVRDLGADDDCTYGFKPSNNFIYITNQQFAPSIDLGTGPDRYVEFPAKASGNDCFTAFPGVNDWYETVKLNYGIDPWDHSQHFYPIPDTWHKMLHILKFWADKGVDAFRCDMAHMVPLEFWHCAIAAVKAQHPDVKFIAEIYDVNLYRPFIQYGGFDYLYDKVNLYDTLRGIVAGQVSAAQITSCWQRVDGIAPHMLNFLENHDEQRIASPEFAGDAAKAIPAMVVSAMMSTGAVMIYGGQELGEAAAGATGFSGDDGRTTIFDYWNIPTIQRWLGPSGRPSLARLTPRERALRRQYRDILDLCCKEPAVAVGRFYDLMYVNFHTPGFNPHTHYAFLRHHGNDTILVVVNFSGEQCHPSVVIPAHAFDFLGIKQGDVEATDLLSGTTATLSVAPDTPIRLDLPPYGAVAYKMQL